MTNSFSWTQLNTDFSFGLKDLGEYNHGVNRGNIKIAKGQEKNYIDFGDKLFSSIQQQSFFIQSSNGNFICRQWMFHKIHGHIAPVIFDLQNKTYYIVDPTRTLWVKRIWIMDDILCGEFSETYWSGTQLIDKPVKMKFLNQFQSVHDFVNLDLSQLKVKIVEWGEGVPKMRIE